MSNDEFHYSPESDPAGYLLHESDKLHDGDITKEEFDCAFKVAIVCALSLLSTSLNGISVSIDSK